MGSDGIGQAGQIVRNCISCGRPIDFNANVCPYCGYDYRVPMMMGPPPVRKTGTPVAGGVLVIIAGILALANGLFYLAFSTSSLTGISLPPEISLEDVASIVRMCGVVEVIFGSVAILGGIFGIRRKHFGLAVLGSVLGMLGLGFTIGGLLGLVGLILVAISRKEFE
jgi:hypothetical protein